MGMSGNPLGVAAVWSGVRSWGFIESVSDRVLSRWWFRAGLFVWVLSVATVVDDPRHASAVGVVLSVGRTRCFFPRHYAVIRESGVPVVMLGTTPGEDARVEKAEAEGRSLGVVRFGDLRSSAGLVGPVVARHWAWLDTNSLENTAAAEIPGVVAQLTPVSHPSLAPFLAGTGPSSTRELHGGWLLHDGVVAVLAVSTVVVPLAVRSARAAREIRERQRRARGQCPTCAYPLPPRPQVGEALLGPGGDGVGVCPECGAAGEGEGAAVG